LLEGDTLEPSGIQIIEAGIMFIKQNCHVKLLVSTTEAEKLEQMALIEKQTKEINKKHRRNPQMIK
jgi:hypothetical protein